MSTEDPIGTRTVNNRARLQDYSRLEQTAFAQACVGDLEAVVVGAGALGNEAVKALGLLGVKRVLVVDPDVVEPSNLTRSVLFRKADYVGCNKAEALVRAAAPLFPDTEFSAVATEIADAGFGRLANASLLFSCVDSDLSRLEIAYISTRLDLPVVDAGLGTPNYAHGRVSWFPGKCGACFGCKLTPRRRRELLTNWDATARSCSQAAEEGQRSSTPTMAAIIGSSQVELGLRWRIENQKESVTFEISLDGAPRCDFFRTPVTPSCPFHESSGDVLVSPPVDCTLGELLDSVKAPAGAEPFLVLDWPICCRSCCSDCAFEWAPLQRAAVVRRRAVCPSCGSRSILEQESIRVIGRNSPWAKATPAALGLPADHLYTVRFHREDS